MSLVYHPDWHNASVSAEARGLAAAFGGYLTEAEGLTGFAPILASAAADESALFTKAARFAEGARHLIILGIGGSALSPACFTGWQRADKRMIFLDRAGVGEVQQCLESLLQNPAASGAEDLPPVRFLVLSKSGKTHETLALLEESLACLRKLGIAESLWPHLIAVVAEAGDNPLHQRAQENGWPFFAVSQAVGSRFSIFTALGLLPAAMSGVDVVALKSGACREAENHSEARFLATAELALAMKAGKVPVLLLHDALLFPLGRWWQQIMAESLGKEGLSPIPLVAYCPADQHSWFQLFLGGGDRFYFTSLDLPQLETNNSPLGEILAAQAEAARRLLIEAGRQGRVLEMPRRDEFSYGALLMHFLEEVFLLAKFFNIAATGQPQVEAGKKVLGEILGKHAS